MIVLVLLVAWAPLAGGAYRGWPLAVSQFLAVLGARVVGVRDDRAPATRVAPNGALDLPLGLLAALVLVQVAVGNGALAAVAPAPPSGDLGAPAGAALALRVGTVSPAQTLRSFRLLLRMPRSTFSSSTSRARARRSIGSWDARAAGRRVLAFLALLDHLSGRAWLRAGSQPSTRGRLSGPSSTPITSPRGSRC